MITENWIPTNANIYMNLTWDKENSILDPNQVTTATLTLTAAPETDSIIDFNFDITITGVE